MQQFLTNVPEAAIGDWTLHVQLTKRDLRATGGTDHRR